MDHDVEQERVTAAVGDDVAEPDQLRPAAGGDPAQGVALEPLGPGRDAPVAVEARRVQRVRRRPPPGAARAVPGRPPAPGRRAGAARSRPAGVAVRGAAPAPLSRRAPPLRALPRSRARGGGTVSGRLKWSPANLWLYP